MTPCEKKGYEVGQVFEAIRDGDTYIDKGDVLILVTDDGSTAPYFKKIHGSEGSMGKRRCMYISDECAEIKRIYPPEEVSKSVEVVCEGKTTTLTREDAEKLNLC